MGKAFLRARNTPLSNAVFAVLNVFIEWAPLDYSFHLNFSIIITGEGREELKI